MTASPLQSPNADICPAGSYCPEGTADPVNCPIGTYSNETGLQSVFECMACTPGFYCSSPGIVEPTGPCEAGFFCQGGAQNAFWEVCTEGSFCPLQSVSGSPCPMGTFSNITGLSNASDCLHCPLGMYCESEGLVVPTGQCGAGYYCPGGSVTRFDFMCPAGLYCPFGSFQPSECASGTFTSEAGSVSCEVCPAGFFCLSVAANYSTLPVQALNSTFNIQPCPAGYVCPIGTGLDWRPCSLGTFSNTTGLSAIDQCTPCSAGMYCSSTGLIRPSGYCFGGYFCSVGNFIPNPNTSAILYSGNNSFQCLLLETIGSICPPGTSCVIGSDTPLPCAEGTYSGDEGQTECWSCPAGFYCPSGTSEFNRFPCSSGHYCPGGTRYANEFPCPVGTFNPYKLAQNLSECLPCSGGKYCESPGLSTPTGNCTEGYFCELAIDLPSPFNETFGSICPIGHYCPEMSAAPDLCDPGSYCGQSGLASPESACSAGFFCSLGADTPTPTDGVTGNICPEGSYCIEGSFSPSECPAGYFLNFTGGRNFSDCHLCLAGMFCSGYGLSAPSGPCHEGYFCPQGQVSPEPLQFACPLAHFCPSGSASATPCPAGTYQDEHMQHTCKECPSGYFCSNATGPVANFEPFICPLGFFCPNGTRYGNEFPCPSGTFSNLTGLQDESVCVPCTGGSVCEQSGLTAPSNLCAAGYFCRSGATQTTPFITNLNGICPEGQFCPEGTDHPMDCPPGTFSNSTGLSLVEQCTSCSSGMYCAAYGLSEPTGPCMEGFYCPIGASNATHILCTAGYFCEEGSAFPSPCPAGTYSPVGGLESESDCLPCPAGHYCATPGITTTTGSCAPGYYCPLGSFTETAVICPTGFHCPQGSPAPQQCLPGTYTNITGSSLCEICEEGFYCLPVREANASGNHLPCPAGYYCPVGTGADWEPCPFGTYSNSTGLSSTSECVPCDGGMYCAELAATEPTGLCVSGFYCTSGIPSPEPLDIQECGYTSYAHQTSSGWYDTGALTVVGGVCPTGHFCVAGSPMPTPCTAGWYNDITGQSECIECQAGFYCTVGSVTYLDLPCPAGHYCPPGSAVPIPCQVGTYNNRSVGINEHSCLPCTPGSYCGEQGLTEPSGECAEGWFCTAGASEPRPSPMYGGRCSIGSYCPIGSLEPLNCTFGCACTTDGLATPDAVCEAGFYCPEGSTSPQALLCPDGTFCPEGSSLPLPCPVATYSDVEGLINNQRCTQCTPGYYCNSSGLTQPSDTCSERFYCPSGQSSPTPPEFICPPGHYCPSASPQPVRCVSGTYQDETGQTSCKTCPSAHFCDNSISPVVLFNDSLCLPGHYCPNGTAFATQYPCPAGTFSNISGLESEQECTPCTPGLFCGEGGLSTPSGPCYPGYFCRTGASSPTPEQSPCPQGHYCPQGISNPITCPMGTFSATIRNANLEDCMPCAPGQFCSEEGAINSTDTACTDGYICTGGAFTPTPNDNVTGYACPVGHFCTSGALVPQRCAMGSYQPDMAQGACVLCPVGSICPSEGLAEAVVCPQVFYCPDGGMLRGEPCPEGSYSNATGINNANDCLLCGQGVYCNVPGLTEPAGVCDAGYLCVSGSSSPTPQDVINSPCPVGFYCTQGATHPVPCPVGTMAPFDEYHYSEFYQNVTLLSVCIERSVSTNESVILTPIAGLSTVEQCIPCIGGYYCQFPNTSIPTGPCNAGYYCPHNASISLPDPVEFQCPVGHHCPTASSSPTLCSSGTFSDIVAAEECEPCPEGHFCSAGTVTPEQCPPRHYCPAGSAEPVFCPNGTYTLNDTVGLASAEQCSPCIAGHFCLAGEIVGECIAGFICYQGSSAPNPTGSDPTVGEPCPEGFYCLAGTLSPSPCPLGLFNIHIGGAQIEDCTLCPPGRVCRIGSFFAELCMPGFYCMNGTASPCPPGTYAPSSGAEDMSFCLPCEAGYYCPNESTVLFTHTPCPIGSYCESGSVIPTPCPSGTHRNTTRAMNISECYLCPSGLYCADNGTVHGVPCAITESCPEGSVAPLPCPPGFYCPEPDLRLPCPPGQYCPEGSSTFIPCPRNHYCEQPQCSLVFIQSAGADSPVICPLGYRETPNLGENATRGTLESTCETCPQGTYMNASDDSESRVCNSCPSGYYCTGGAVIGEPDFTLILNSFVCPVGHYCPSDGDFGSSMPTACPEGTYNALEGQSELSVCLLCPLNSFTHLPGQAGCFSCSTQASTSQQGATLCQCSGLNREFQPSDGTCPCISGYDEARSDDCVPIVYDTCAEGSFRSQDGMCRTPAEWEEFCTSQGCRSPGLYVNFDRSLGICTCQTQVLDDVCDARCRRDNIRKLRLVCSNPPSVAITDIAGERRSIPLSSIAGLFRGSANSLCGSLNGRETPMFLVESTFGGFRGNYNAAAEQIVQLLFSQRPEVVADGLLDSTQRQKRQTVNDAELLNVTAEDDPLFDGIDDPIVCLELGQSLIFRVSNTSYPIYDRNSLLNSNSDFDGGFFLQLAESQQLTGVSSLFAFPFTESGFFVFYLSNDANRKIYVRVMEESAQCPELGPFFPNTASLAVQLGVVRNADILQAPNWVLIGSLLGVAVVLMLILVIALVLFRKYGWSKALIHHPKYRKVNKQYRLDKYSSKGSTVKSQKQVHEKMLLYASQSEGTQAELPKSLQPVAGDEFWDYEHQADLEAFSSRQLYQQLADQSHRVVASISSQSDQAKSLFHKISTEAESLKSLWVAKLNLQGRSEMASPEELRAYEKLNEEYLCEQSRRKELGQQFSQVLSGQLRSTQELEGKREEHRIQFDTAMREAVKSLEWCSSLQAQRSDKDTARESWIDTNSLHSQVDDLVNQLSSSVQSHAMECGAPSVCGQQFGAQLVCTDTGETVSVQQLNSAITSGDESLVIKDSATELLIPGPSTRIRLASGSIERIPPHHVIDPATGRVVPMEGHVCYDPFTKKLVFTSSSHKSAIRDEPLIPFVPYPLSAETGQPVETGLERASELRLGGSMTDPLTGISVPIRAVTMHPRTHTFLPVGGTHIDPVTSLPVAIDLYSMMLDAETGLPTLIVNVCIDATSGRVLPVGGSIEIQENGKICHKTLFLGESFIEPLSQLPGKTTSAYVCAGDGSLVQGAGGFLALLDTSELAEEKATIEALIALQDIVRVSNDKQTFATALEKVNAQNNESLLLRSRNQSTYLRAVHKLQAKKGSSDKLASSGGSPGYMEYKPTGQPLPLLLGLSIPDEATKMQVPVLGYEVNPVLGTVEPLCGTMKAPRGSDTVPIMIGEPAYSEALNQLAPIVGVQRDPDTGVVVPVTQGAIQAKNKRVSSSVMLVLEEEFAARRSFWRRSDSLRKEVVSSVSKAQFSMLHSGSQHRAASTREALRTLEELNTKLTELLKAEKHRRHVARTEISSQLPEDVVSMLLLVEGQELGGSAAAGGQAVAAGVRFGEVVEKMLVRINGEESRHQSRIEELKEANNPEAVRQLTEQHTEKMASLLSSIEQQLRSQQQTVYSAVASEEYIRNKSQLCSQQAKALLSGAAVLFSVEVGWGCQSGSSSLPAGPAQLQPLLQHLLRLVEGCALQGGDGEAEAADHLAQSSTSTTPERPVSSLLKHKRSFARNVDRESVEPSAAQTQLKEGWTEQPPVDSTAKATAKKLIEKHAIEDVKLENSLQSEESSTIKKAIEEFEENKKILIEHEKDDILNLLSQQADDEAKQQIMLERAEVLEQKIIQFEAEKQLLIETKLKELVEKRIKAKTELSKAHLDEAREQGLTTSHLGSTPSPRPELLMKDLTRLVQLEETLMADINVGLVEEKKNRLEKEDAMRRAAMNNKMHHRLERLNCTDVQKHVAESEQLDSGSAARRTNVKSKLRSRMKERSKRTAPSAQAHSVMVEAALLEALDADALSDKVNVEKSILVSVGQGNESVPAMLEEYDAEGMEAACAEQSGAGDRQASAVLKVAQKRLEEEVRREEEIQEQLKLSSLKEAQLGGSEDSALLHLDLKSGEDDQLKRQDLYDSQIQQQANLDMKHLKELSDLELAAQEEKQGAIAGINSHAVDQMKLAMKRRETEFQQELLAKQEHGQASAAETDQLIVAHQQEVTTLKESLASEQQQQKKVLLDKVSERKRKKGERLIESQNIESEKLLSQQKTEREDLESSQLVDAEKLALNDLLKNRKPEEVESLIYHVLRQRHFRETVQLAVQHERQQKLAVEESKCVVKAKRQELRDAVTAEQEKAIIELISKSSSISNSELSKQKLELKKDQKRKLAEFDQATHVNLEAVSSEVTPEMHIQYNEQLLSLRERQIKQLANAMEELSPEKTLIKSYNDEAELAAQEAERYRREVVEARKVKLEKLREARLQREQERKSERQQQLRELEAEVAKEKQKDAEREQQLKLKYEQIHQQRLAEQETLHQESLEKTVSQQERERIVAEHHKAMEIMSDKFDQEQQNQLSRLQQEITKRRERKQKKRLKQLEENEVRAARADLEEEKKRVQQVNVEQAEQLQKQVETATHRPFTPTLKEAPTPQDPPRDADPIPAPLDVPLGDTDISQLIMATPIFSQLSEIELLLQGKPQAGGHTSQLRECEPYIDIRDAQWECKGKLVPTDIQSLKASDFVVYRFGTFVSRLLMNRNSLPEVTVLLASNLPPNNYHKNCFKNSFYYEHSRNILFVRKERMESVGEFVLVIMHCLAHLKVGDITDDTNPLFLREFYQAIRTVCQDLFFACSNKPLHVGGGGVGQPARPGEQLAAVFQHSSDWEHRGRVTDELINMKVKVPTLLEYTDEAVAERICSYESTLDATKIHKLLAETSHQVPLKADKLTSKHSEDESSVAVQTDPKQLLEAQIAQLGSEIDKCNIKLSSLLVRELEIRSRLEAEGGRSDAGATEQLKQVQKHKEAVVKKISDFSQAKQDITKSLLI